MAIASFRLSADVGRDNYKKTLIMKQGDRASRRLIVQLYEDGNPIALEPTAVVRMNVRRPDGEIAPSVGSVRADGMIEAIFSDEALAVAGMISVSISVFGEGNALLTSTTIVMMVQPSEGEAELTVYRAAEELEAGAYYVVVAGIPFGFTTAETLPENGTIVFSSDFGTAKTLDATGTEIEDGITVTRGSSSGTQLVGTPVIGMIDELIAQMVETKAIAQSVRSDADAGVFDGEPGAPGAPGVSVENVQIRADNHLIVTLSNGQTIDAGEIQGGGGTADHRELAHRNAPDQHAMSAITGLSAALAGKQDTISDLSDIRTGAAAGATALQPSALNPYRTAQAQDLIDSTLQGEIEAIEGKIPSSASSTNKLVTGDQMSEAISAVEAKQIYKTAAQGSFATKAELIAAQTFYNADGTVATPTKNDVAYVLADETHDGKLAKYVIAATDPLVWGFVIAISGTDFTQEQLDALNSGITNAKRTGYDTHVANGDIHVTEEQKTAWSAKQGAITDLAEIRSGAEAGATALQSVPNTYRTAAAQDVIDAGKQEALTAGSGISIVGNVIAANGDTITTSSSGTVTLKNHDTTVISGTPSSVSVTLPTPTSGYDYIAGLILKPYGYDLTFSETAPPGYAIVWDFMPSWHSDTIYEISYRCLWYANSNGDIIISVKWSEI